MDPKHHIETYKNLNIKDYVHSLYQAKYLTSLNNVIIGGAKYNKEFSSIPKVVVKSLNEEYDIKSPYFNLVKGNVKYKPTKKVKNPDEVNTNNQTKITSKTKGKVNKKNNNNIHAGEVSTQSNVEIPNSSNVNTFLSTGVIPN